MEARWMLHLHWVPGCRGMLVSGVLQWLLAVAFAADAAEVVAASGCLAAGCPGAFDEERIESGQASVRQDCSARHSVVFAVFQPGSCWVVGSVVVVATAGYDAAEVADVDDAAALVGFDAVVAADAVDAAALGGSDAVAAADAVDAAVPVAVAHVAVAHAVAAAAPVAAGYAVAAAAGVAGLFAELAAVSFLVDSSESPACHPSCTVAVRSSAALVRTAGGRIVAEIRPLLRNVSNTGADCQHKEK